MSLIQNEASGFEAEAVYPDSTIHPPNLHVAGSLAAHPAETPLFPPAYSPYAPQGYQPQGQAHPVSPPHLPYQGYPDYPAYPAHPVYPGNAYAPYAWRSWQPPQPKRDGYLLAIATSSVVGSSLALLAGLIFTLLLLLLAIVPRTMMNDSQAFGGIVGILTFTCAGVLGGAFGLYHSIRSLMKKPSADFSLSRFWIFLVLYLAVIGIAFLLQSRGQEVAFPVLTVVLIALAGIFPALTVVALGLRRLGTLVAKPLTISWPTSWRRFALALSGGATLSIGLALVLELVLTMVLTSITHIPMVQNPSLCVDMPDMQSCQNPGVYSFVLLVLAVVAPLVEETVKPLAVILLIGRIRSAAEVFVLGMACGIGFDLVETTLYISSGYHNWLSIALLRTCAGLLHGFGAAMVALGWYHLTHAKKRRLLLALACWSYAVLQHALWNGSWGVALLPAPVGPFLGNWALHLGFISIPFFGLINIAEALFMLAFFIYITGKLRSKVASPAVPPSSQEGSRQKLPAPQAVG
jgi:RsiW-degrading membrane proteinase PrsW (M82 family)